MKLLKKTILLAAGVLTLSGCIPHTELDKQAIVEAVGIDFAEDKYEVTVQYFNMEGAGGNSPIDPSKGNVINITGKGDSVSTALESASVKCGRTFMYGITGIIVLGRDALDRDILDTLSFAESYYQSNTGVLIAAAEDKASDIIGVKFKEGVVSVEKLKMLLENAEDKGICSRTNIITLLSDQHRPFAATALPMLKMEDSGSDASDDGKSVVISGGILVSERKAAGDLTLSDLSALQLLGGNPQNTNVIADMNGEQVSVTVYDIDADLEHDFEDGRLIFDIDIHANGKYTDSQLENKDASFSNAVEKVCAEIIEERVSRGLQNTVLKYGTDPIGLKYVISSESYTEWVRVEESFTDYLKGAVFHIDCDIDIDRFGIVH